MLDSILRRNQAKDIDWQFIQKALDRALEKFSRIWILGAIIAPLIVFFGYGYSQETTRMIIAGFFVGIGIIAHVARLLFAQDRLIWRPSLISSLFLALLIGVALVIDRKSVV